MDGLELLNSHWSVKPSLLIHTTTPASVSVLLQGSWYVYFPPRRVSLCHPHQSCYPPASWQWEKERQCFYVSASLCLSSFGIPSEKGQNRILQLPWWEMPADWRSRACTSGSAWSQKAMTGTLLSLTHPPAWGSSVVTPFLPQREGTFRIS